LWGDLALTLSDDFVIRGVWGEVTVVCRLFVGVNAAMFPPRLDRTRLHLNRYPSSLPPLMTTRSNPMLLMDTRPLGNDTSSAIYRMVIDLIMVEVFVERRGRIAVDVGR